MTEHQKYSFQVWANAIGFAYNCVIDAIVNLPVEKWAEDNPGRVALLTYCQTLHRMALETAQQCEDWPFDSSQAEGMILKRRLANLPEECQVKVVNFLLNQGGRPGSTV